MIPDDPIFDDGEDDPFDTNIAVVKKIVKEEEQKKKKEDTRLKFTGLSAVADVLSGKSEKVDPSVVEHAVKRKRRRANRINLIGDDASAVTAVEEIAAVSKPEAKDDTADEGGYNIDYVGMLNNTKLGRELRPACLLAARRCACHCRCMHCAL